MSTPNPHDDPAALKELQDAIYRDKVLRARGMSNEQRFDEALELTNGVFQRMAEGVMWQLGLNEPKEVWNESKTSYGSLGSCARSRALCDRHWEAEMIRR